MKKFVIALLIFTHCNTNQADEPKRKLGFILPPIESLLLPGFDQWWEGQNGKAFAFTGTAVTGIIIASMAATYVVNLPESQRSGLTSRDNSVRMFQLGGQMWLNSSFLSAYDSFRYAFHTREDDFPFLDKKETLGDVLTAPVHFEYLARWTTILPMAVMGALITLEAVQPNVRWRGAGGDDLFFAGAFSYGAGTSEEALFRGWMMPVLHYYMPLGIVSNTLTAALFGAAHISPTNPVPWPQFLIGLYLGMVTQHRGWSITESVFIHTWWDILAFVSGYALGDVNARIQFAPIMIRF